MTTKRIVKICPKHGELTIGCVMISGINVVHCKRCHPLVGKRFNGSPIGGFSSKGAPKRTKKKIAEAQSMLAELDKRKEEIRLRQLQESEDEI